MLSGGPQTYTTTSLTLNLFMVVALDRSEQVREVY